MSETGNWYREIEYSEVSPYPLPSQALFHKLKTRFKYFSGPVGSGKSRAFGFEALRLAYANPGRLGLISAPTYRMLHDATMIELMDIIEFNEIPYSINKADKILTLNECDSTILLRSLDAPDRLRGTNLAWFGVDELTYAKRQAWGRLEGRLRDKQAPERCGFGVGTPKGFDWVYKKFIDNPALNIGVVRAVPYENTHNAEDYYDNLKASYDEDFFAQEALGIYLNVFAGMVYRSFDRRENCELLEFNPAYGVSLSLDFNIDPACSVICQNIDGRVFVLDELYLTKGKNTEEHCAEIHRRLENYLDPYLEETGRKMPINIYGDPAGNQRRSSAGADVTDWVVVRKSFERNAKAYGEVLFRVSAAQPTQKARITAVNGLLKNYLGERRLIVDVKCKELIADFEELGYVEGSSEIDKNKDSRRSHLSDSLAYLIEKEYGLKQKNQAIEGRSKL